MIRIMLLFVMLLILLISIPDFLIASEQISESGPIGRAIVLIYGLGMFIACNFFLYQKLFREPREQAGEERSTIKEKIKIMLPVLLLVGVVISLSLIIGNYLAESIGIERMYGFIVILVEYSPLFVALFTVIMVGVVMWKSLSRPY